MLTLPDRLQLGDTVGLIAPASPTRDPKLVDQSVAALEEMGFRVKLGRYARERLGFLAGTDGERADDLMRMFADRVVRGIFCVRGGYGTSRLASLLDYEVILENPKVFVGYSDMTFLHGAFLTKANLLSFHGPVPSEFIPPDAPAFSRDSLLRLLTQPEPGGSICQGYDRKTVSVLHGGSVTGELIGGNLTILCTLIGTPFEPSLPGKILFLEDVGEKPYRMDRMLTHLLNAGKLQEVAGVAVGICKGCDDPEAATAREYRQTLQDVFQERLAPLNIPVVTGLPFGHVPHNATLPVGGSATLDAVNGDLILTSAAVE